MNDLSGLNWSTSAPNNNPNTNRNNDRFSSLRPTPPITSRHPSPLSSAGRPTPPPQTQSRPASSDPFASLGSSNKKTELSLQEKQKQLLEEKRRQAFGQTAGPHDPVKTSDASFWEGFGSGRSTPAQAASATPAMTSVGLSVRVECLEGTG